MKKNNLSKYVLALIIISNLSFSAYAHPGRTDSAGGHYNRSTGEYHYHHGYPAHQHPDGICPYDFDDQTDYSVSDEVETVETTAPKRFAPKTSGDEGFTTAYNNLRKENENLKVSNEELESEIALLKYENSEIRFSNDHLKSTRKKLLYSLIAAVTIGIPSICFCFHSMKSKKNYASELSVVKRNHAELQTEYDSLKKTDWVKQLSEKQKEINDLLQSTHELRGRIFALKEELKKSQNFSKDLQCDKNILEMQRRRLRDDLDKTRRELEKALKGNLQEEEYISFLRSELEALSTDILSFPKEILYEAGVPNGVTFDKNFLPHYYAQPSVEKNMRVYISKGGKSYHRKFGCSGSTIPIHLFVAATKYTPCERCIPYKAWNYKVPQWYYDFLALLAKYEQEQPQLEDKTSDTSSETEQV